MQISLDTIELNPNTETKVSIIWMHGLGADKYDFVPVAKQMNLPEKFGVRFVFPQAPTQAVTINGGMHMPSWFDIKAVNLTEEQDREGILSAQELIEQLIENEIARGILSHQIFLAGFSQGGALALQTGLRHKKKLGGIIALSCFLPLARSLVQERSLENQNIPIFMAHGTYDPLILLDWAKKSYQFLAELGYPIDLKIYPMEHSVCNQEIDDISNWLLTLL